VAEGAAGDWEERITSKGTKITEKEKAELGAKNAKTDLL
jgi:hypothetical protein